MSTFHHLAAFHRSALLPIAMLALLAASADGAVSTWVGTGVDNRFSTPGNWDAFPSSGDDLVFPANVWNTTNRPVNDIVGLVVNAIDIYQTYTITGNAVSIQIINVNNPGITNVALPLATVGSAVLTITVLDGGGTLNLSGLISGNGPATYGGPGAKRLTGTVNNTLSGLTSVALGTLELASTASEAIAGPLAINSGAIVLLTNAPDIKDSVVVTVNGDLDLSAATGSDGANTETIGGLAGNGTIHLGAHTLGCVGQSAPTNFAGGFFGTGSFRQFGSGIQVLSGTSVPYAGTVLLAGGQLHVWGNETGSPISVTSGTLVLAHDCAVGSVTLAGGSASTLACTSLSAMALHGTAAPDLTIGSGCRYRVDVNPTTNSRVSASTVTLSGATLVVDTSLFTPTVSSVMTIIDNTGASPIGGTFAGLPQGATVTSSTNTGTKLTISYTGGTGNDVTLTCTANASDTTAPTLSAIAAGAITPGSATITWTTDEASTSQVEYGIAATYGSMTDLDGGLVTSHSVLVGRLSPGTVYHYRVRSADAAGNLAVSTDQTFTTAATIGAPAVITAVAATTGTTTAAVTWTTSENADSQVEYGPTIGYGTLTTRDSTMVTAHNVALAGLTASTTYHYRVISTDADGNVTMSADHALTTAAVHHSHHHTCGLGGVFGAGIALGLLLVARSRT